MRQLEFGFVRNELFWKGSLQDEIFESFGKIKEQYLLPTTMLMHPDTWKSILELAA